VAIFPATLGNIENVFLNRYLVVKKEFNPLRLFGLAAAAPLLAAVMRAAESEA
jgi:hypothetical protein